jgi:parallel beta-helix repeat protein
MKRVVSAILLVILLTSMLCSAFKIMPAEAAGTIYIRADGSIDPPAANITTFDNITYTFTDSIYDSIVVERDNVVVDGGGYTVQGTGSGTGLSLSGRNNVTIKSMTISAFYSGIELSSSSSSSISGNNITANNVCGIGLYSSSNSSISGNNITNNGYGIRLEYFSSNSIFHNNFVNNTNQAYSYNSVNVWDDGYPSGGNYWSDYTGVDMKSGFYQNESGSDGVGDTAYSIGVAYQDNYPLVGIFNAYNVTYYTPPLVSHACNVTVISNSTISDFVAPIWIEHPEVIFLQFNVSGAEGSTGFCRVSFPTAMMNGTCHVSVNGTEILYTLLSCSDANYSYLYFNYTHSTQEVIIIPESPSFLILPLFFIATLLAVIVYRRKHFYSTGR